MTPFTLDMIVDLKAFVDGLPGSLSGPDGTVDDLIEYVDMLGLSMTLKALRRLEEAVDNGLPAAEVKRRASDVKSRFLDESGLGLLVFIDEGARDYFDPLDPLFGYEVADKFPEAAYDIDCAGKSFGMGLYTACVFHLMRAVEFALRQLAVAVNIEWNKPWSSDYEQWKVIIDLIDKRIKKLEDLPKSDERQAAMSAYSDVSADLRAFKDAWRNHVSHSRDQYDEQRAERVYRHVHDFMKRVCDLPVFPIK